jgi:uncharacterized protein YdhG (YjbR/CyaY superfamily)
VSSEQVDEYLHALEKPKRSALATLRRTILEVAPDAEPVICYKRTKSSLHFPVDAPLPRTLVRKLIDVRLAEVE